MKDPAGQTDPLVAAAASFIDARRLLSRGQAVVVGVSGGADSVALLAVLRELSARPDRAYRLTAAHLHHGLRDSADADAAFVTERAEAWRVPCVSERRDVAALARRDGLGIEEAARNARYAFLSEVAAGCGATAVAVGHHADDQAETVLYRLVRGAHLRGLAGMPAERPLGGGGLRLVRPLLEARREQIEAFCRRGDLPWRTDETNAQTHYRRNFVRHELLPLLRERLNARADEALLRLARSAGEVEDYLASQGAAALARARRAGGGGSSPRRGLLLSAARLADEPAVVRTYALRAAVEQLGVPPGQLSAEHLAELTDLPSLPPPAAAPLPGGFLARREGDVLVIEADRPACTPGAWRASLQCPGRTLLPDGRAVACRLGEFDEPAFRAHCAGHSPGVELLDADGVHGSLSCRPRREGDAFVPLGAPGTQSVGDFLTNLKLPRRDRDAVCCITDERGIVYLAPLRVAERVKVTAATRTVLRIDLQPSGEAP